MEERSPRPAPDLRVATLEVLPEDVERVATGLPGVDRVLGGGLVAASVVLLAGEPGVGKSTLLLQVLSGLGAAGMPCLLASGEESRRQVASRAARLGIEGSALRFLPGRELPEVVEAARSIRPFLLAVDSVQTLRHPDVPGVPGSPGQVRACADALVALAKAEGVAVLVTGHVTKEGDLAGPRTLEHAVDVVLSFGGDAGSGLRVLVGGKNRFGPEGEGAWFEMGAAGLREIDPTGLLLSKDREAGAAVALPRAGRRALAVEVQALVGPEEGSGRRVATGLDARRFQLVAAVVDRVAGIRLGRSDVYGASSGGFRVDDPGCDLAIAAAVASAACGVPPPPGMAFVGEVGLTGGLRPVAAMEARVAAAREAGCRAVVVPAGHPPPRSAGVRIVPASHVTAALGWALEGRRKGGGARRPRTATHAL